MKHTHGDWPRLEYLGREDEVATLHRWLQVVGKLKVALVPWLNHSWHVTLLPTVRGFSTGPMHVGADLLEVKFDFVAHELLLQTARAERRIALEPMTVRVFHGAVQDAVRALGFAVDPHGAPNELADNTPFAEDSEHGSYSREYTEALWRVMMSTARVLERFRTGFVGKCSPVHLFWGSLDLAVTRFSGRRAPRHPGGIPNLPDDVTAEAYSHEVSSAGFWPGGGPLDVPAFYSYAYPTPDGFAAQTVGPAAARFLSDAGEFAVDYDAIATAADPDGELLKFLATTYEAAARLAGWDREALECSLGVPGRPRAISDR